MNDTARRSMILELSLEFGISATYVALAVGKHGFNMEAIRQELQVRYDD